jgi:hypothetical protein
MDKLITVEYCKRQKFPTKTDFMNFVKTSAVLTKFIKGSDLCIEDFKCSKLEELDELLETSRVASSMAVYLLGVKERVKERVECKRKAEKDIVKSVMRDEIMRELRDEKVMTRYSDYVPLDPELKEKFSMWLDKGLDESQLDELPWFILDFMREKSFC